MFESDDPTNLDGHRPKGFLQMAKYNQVPQGDFRGYLQANPNTILRYNISNYNEGHGEIRQTTLKPETHYEQTFIRPSWATVPPENMDAIRKEKQRLIDQNVVTTPEHRAALEQETRWSSGVVAVLVFALLMTMVAVQIA